MRWWNSWRQKTLPKFTPPVPWVDIHAHIAPGVDDGAKTLDDALAMVRRAGALGVTHIVATVHYSDLFSASAEEVTASMRKLTGAVLAEECAVRIVAGREISFTDLHIQELRSNTRYCIAGSRNHALIELPEGLNRAAAIEGFFELMVSGIRPIVAHPERNSLVQRDPSIIKELRQRNVLMQVDAMSITGAHGSRVKKTALSLLQTGQVDVISSDAHRVDDYANYELACRMVCDRLGEGYLRRVISDVPSRIVNAQ